MSKLAAFREAERKLQEQMQLLEKLKADSWSSAMNWKSS